MNAKKVKLLRRILRSRGVDVTQRTYESLIAKVEKILLPELTEEGESQYAHLPKISMVLTEGCGRRLYKQAKAAICG